MQGHLDCIRPLHPLSSQPHWAFLKFFRNSSSRHCPQAGLCVCARVIRLLGVFREQGGGCKGPTRLGGVTRKEGVAVFAVKTANHCSRPPLLQLLGTTHIPRCLPLSLSLGPGPGVVSPSSSSGAVRFAPLVSLLAKHRLSSAAMAHVLQLFAVILSSALVQASALLNDT